MKFDLKTTTAIKDFEIRGDRWYSVFDDKQMKHLQVIGGDIALGLSISCRVITTQSNFHQEGCW